MKEELKDIQGYEGRYRASNLGYVVLPSGKYKFHHKDTQGYCITFLNKNGRKCHKVHRLVAIAFLPNPRNLREVNHKDGDKTNNNVSNLEWVSSSENKAHSYITGLRPTRISVKDTVNIRKRVLHGETQTSLAKEYGVHFSYIWKIVHGIKKSYVT